MATATAKKVTKKTLSKPSTKSGAGQAKKAAPKSGGFAVFADGGKQYKVSVGDIVTLEKPKKEVKEGSKISFGEVLLTDDGKATKVGTPTVKGAKVEGEVIKQGLGKKITVIRFRSKSRHFVKKGHRQPFIKVKITKI